MAAYAALAVLLRVSHLAFAGHARAHGAHGATVASSPVYSAEFLRACGNSTADAATCDACTGNH